MFERIVCLVIGYAFGCFLTADAVVRHVRGVSAFDIGLGNPGMANVGATLGTRWALVTLAGDVLKTLIPMLICRFLFGQSMGVGAELWTGLGVTLGHNYPIWHAFKGGKGVATTCSTVIFSMPVIGLVSCILGAVVVVITHYLCWGAVAITLAFLVLALFSGSSDAVIVAIALTILMGIAHGSAIAGIKTGETTQTDLLAKLKKKR